MAWYFRKRVKIFKGINLNLSKSGMSLSVGPRGAKINISKRGTYLTTGIPGTGIYARTKISGGTKRGQRATTAFDEEKRKMQNEAINNNPLSIFVFWFSFLIAIIVPLVTDLAWWWFFVISIGGFILGLLMYDFNDDIEIVPSEETSVETLQITEEEIKKQAAKDEENINFIKDFCTSHNFDELFPSVVIDVVQCHQWSISQIMRKYGIGYARIGKMADLSTDLGIVSDVEVAKPRSVLCENLEQLRKVLVETSNIDEMVKHHVYPTPFKIEEESTGLSTSDIDKHSLDPLFENVAKLVVLNQKGSISLIQRNFSIGYNRAGLIMDQLEKTGIVGKAYGSKPREVLVKNINSLEEIISNTDKNNY